MQADDSDLRGLTDDVYKVREDLLAAVREGEEVTGVSGDGTVTAVLAADGKLVDLTVDESVIDPDDPLRLTDAVIGAVNDAHRVLVEQQQQRARAASAGLQSLADRMRAEAARTRSEFAQTRFPLPPGAGRGGGPANRS